ncbi:hypothetical protein [Mesorhizobium sp. SP-1A]|uniref:hypothetical protein n=1 Tax=Mesorhizobium sp. SP-1A TaxID=3077840 RepID=UPI0028F719CE|nr:hypothetical protein [Mesorhizobium sp. SP-1A]
MGSAFYNAIGYGMPWHDFENEVILDCEAHKTKQVFENIFDSATDEMLTVPLEEHNKVWYGTDPIPSFSELRLLSKTYTDGNRKPADIGRAEDLYQLVFGPDDRDPRHIIFFPNLTYRKEWCRRSDYLDQMIERWRPGMTEDNWRPEDRIRYLNEGFDVFCHYIMEPDGTPIRMDDYRFPITPEEQRWKENLKVVPQIPSEIRWYLKKLGIMNDAGINKLRPIIAYWWT